MKRSIFTAMMAIAFAPVTHAAGFAWTNYLGNNDFGAFSNWWSSANVLTTFTTNSLRINHFGANRAVISNTVDSSLSSCGSVQLATTATSTGEVLVTSGTNAFGAMTQVGLRGVGIFTLIDGSVAFPTSYTTIAENTNSVGIFNMSGGSFTTDRMTVATTNDAVGTVIITGGTVAIARSNTTSSTAGHLRMGRGAAQIHIGGSAQVTVEFLLFGKTNNVPIDPGFMTMSNGVLNITGATWTNASPITFCPGRTAAFEGGVWNVAGNLTAEIEQAIADGYIFHSKGNNLITVVYSNSINTTVVKLREPTSLEAWRYQHFGTTENAGNAANTADLEKDGIPNLAEFAFGLHPLQCSACQLPMCAVSGGNLTIEFPKPGGVSGIAYGAESSTNLINWSAVTNSGGGTTNIFSIAVGSEPRMFMRLLATEQ